ncbi:hypothetical protein ACTI_84110 [Actinoplanes sp. OR16]|nr:hypothetical protein ACTI_84110 [Actinoplanes sp. OR16]
MFAIASWILPAINDRVSVDDPIRAGDVIQVGPDVRFVPVTGANLVSGLRQGQPDVAGYPRRDRADRLGQPGPSVAAA